jgi:hypothetical protein
MASRSSAGIGVGITITLLGVLSLALFITTIVFLSKYNAAQRQLTQNIQDSEAYVRQDERQSDAVQRILDTARKDRKSVIGYLNESLRNTMSAVSGSANDTYESLQAKLKSVPGAESNNLLGVIRDRDQQIAALNTQLKESNDARQTALADRNNEVERVKQLTEAHQKTIDTMNADIDRYRAEVEQYRNAVDQAKDFMTKEVEKARDEGTKTAAALSEKNRGLENENLQLKDQLAKLREQNKPNLLRPTSEAALVDGSIIGLNPSGNEVTISLGAKDKVILGMSFAVYSDAAAIKPDATTGNYPAGKATIEVINIGETSSTCRVTHEIRGNPIVRGDVIANAIYDPSKVYTFLVYGNFDANGDGVATPGEADDIRAMITAWGGKVTDELTGNVDFLVLGQRPQLPPKPRADDPPAVVGEYIRLDTLAQRYDRLLEQATSTSMPILNENRLYTLIGRRAGSR